MDQRHLLYIAALIVGLLVGFGVAQQIESLQGEAINVPNPFKEAGDAVQLNDNYICCCLAGVDQVCWSRSDSTGETECSSSCKNLYDTDSYKYAEWK